MSTEGFIQISKRVIITKYQIRLIKRTKLQFVATFTSITFIVILFVCTGTLSWKALLSYVTEKFRIILICDSCICMSYVSKKSEAIIFLIKLKRFNLVLGDPRYFHCMDSCFSFSGQIPSQITYLTPKCFRFSLYLVKRYTHVHSDSLHFCCKHFGYSFWTFIKYMAMNDGFYWQTCLLYFTCWRSPVFHDNIMNSINNLFGACSLARRGSSLISLSCLNSLIHRLTVRWGNILYTHKTSVHWSGLAFHPRFQELITDLLDAGSKFQRNLDIGLKNKTTKNNYYNNLYEIYTHTNVHST